MHQVRDEARRDVGSASAVVDERPDGDLQGKVFAVTTGAVRAFAVATLWRVEFGMKAETDQRVDVGACDDVDRAAMAAVAAARTAAGNVLFTPECQATTTAVARRDVNVYFVDK